ncbi:MAG: phosphate signaling complex protein PhoU [Acaryochloris sp. RU_4_1]|nr:phosphate signaling complex protein PhoU [Acaryochloris sp. SU_5_25]NJM64513.1 phosphate signaling complex protein PhoU [Acaryochloris sp. RU_4_1]NJR53406.1 phosphate signaling complex protein PhoU [Acaryochloris sp. CRU_2_0]
MLIQVPLPNVTKSIRRQFERQLQAIQKDALRMGALVEQSCRFAHRALFKRDLSVVDTLATQDKQIDQLYRHIEVQCLQLIALQSPVANDLRLIGALIQLIRDLERIGDYAEDISEVAVKLFPYPVAAYMPEIEHMSELCQGMLALSLSALTQLDAQAGLQVKIEDDAVDDCYDRLYTVLAHQPVEHGSAEPLLLSMLVIRSLERMADHATNIGQRVAYIVTGQR